MNMPDTKMSKENMGIEVLQPGPLTTVQDLGRFGYLSRGIGNSGVMDRDAYRIANELTDNKNGEAVLEMTLCGGQLRFLQDTIAAITGAYMKPVLDDREIRIYEAFEIKKGQILQMGMAMTGCRAYLSVRGGIDVEKVLNSRSTDLKAGIGGYKGRKLMTGDILKIGLRQKPHPAELKKLQSYRAEIPVFQKEITVRVIEGPQAELFTTEGIDSFYSKSYTVTPDSDRMGIRLKGAVINGRQGTDIISDGIVFGSIQIPASGQPIILMADHQTTGGYAKIATVVSCDLGLLSQAKPGDSVRFKKVSVDEMQPKKFSLGGLFK